MSNDTAPCGCEGHASNFEKCKYPILKATVERAAGEARHAYRAVARGEPIDPNLIARVIVILERAAT